MQQYLSPATFKHPLMFYIIYLPMQC